MLFSGDFQCLIIAPHTLQQRAETAIALGRGQHPTEDANLCSSFDFQNRQEPYFIDRTKETCVPQNQTVD